jgi:MFS family permease
MRWSPTSVHRICAAVRQSLDTIGSFLGPLLAIALMALAANNFSLVFWVAAIPAFLSLALILVAVREPKRAQDLAPARLPWRRAELGRLGAAYWRVVGVAALFALARFSEAFLVLRGQSIGLPLMLTPMVLVIMNVAYSASAYPVGVLSDRVGRVTLLILGLALLIAADIALALATGIFGLGLGVALWGLHMGFTQGMLATLVADVAPAELRGTAFGIFNLVTGIILLFASALAGLLWDLAGPKGAFLAGAAFALLTLVFLLSLRKQMDAPVELPAATKLKNFCN